MTLEEIAAPYLEKGFTALEFIRFARNNPSYFINYCELVITPRGRIYLSIPSHINKMVELASKHSKFKKSEIPVDCDVISWIVSKYGYIACWNEFQRVPPAEIVKTPKELVMNYEIDKQFLFKDELLTVPQRKALNMLRNAELIDINLEVESEYQKYIIRRDVYKAYK